MGIGKTIEAIALILAHPSRDPLRKTTLIVAPLALLRQWKREIATKIKPGHRLSTLIFHGPNTRKMNIDELLEYDIVLCTYQKLASEYRRAVELSKPLSVAILHRRARFYRVILDEAHNIKNKDAKSSLAAEMVKARYRLCLTGTPFMNRASEIFPLVRFLHIKPYSQWEQFSEAIDRPIAKWEGDMGDRALRKLQALVRSITLRRTKESRLDGRPIIQLPARRDLDAHTEFNEDQAAFYYALEHQQQLKFNKYLRAGTAMKNYIFALVLLLRLRQVCDHPHLIKDHGIPEGAKLSPDDMLALAVQLPDDAVERLKMIEEFECPICDEKTENAVIIIPCGHHICSACYSASMTLRHTNGDGEKPASIGCPQENCDGQIFPDNVTLHNFFVDAHMPGDNDDPANGFFDNDEEYSDYNSEDEDERDENGDLRGFVVDDDSEEYEERGVSPFRMPDGDTFVNASRPNKPDSNGDRSSGGEDTDEEGPWRGNYGGLFVTQSPERRPAGESGSYDNEMADTSANQIDDSDQEARAAEENELEWEVLDDGRMVWRNVERSAVPPLVQQPTTPAPVERATAAPKIERATAAPKMERDPTPQFRSPQVVTAKGTIDDPVSLSDDEVLDEFLATSRLSDHRSEARPIKKEKEVVVIDIETYDGPSSQNIGRRSGKRPSGRDTIMSIKRARTSMAQDTWVDRNERRRNAVPRGSFINLSEEAGPVNASQGDYASPNRRDRTARAIPQDNFVDPDSPVPSIERRPRAAPARRKQTQRRSNFVSLGELRIDATKSAAAMHRYRRRLRKEWVSSAKIDKIMSILDTVRAGPQPRDKTLVFSLWTSFLDLLEVPIEDAGFVYTRYDGSMKPEHRDAAVKNFEENPDVEVMLISLTAGNAGLNLTAGSQVIIAEPFWNPYTEEQAIDRAHRIGQEREVTVHRVLIAGTVEDRIVALQEKKRALVNAALSEKGAAQAGRLTVEELRGLFGI